MSVDQRHHLQLSCFFSEQESLGLQGSPKTTCFLVFRITCLCKRSKQKSPPEETNMSPKKGPFQKERMVFQPLFFRGHVSFWVGIFLKQIQVDW